MISEWIGKSWSGWIIATIHLIIALMLILGIVHWIDAQSIQTPLLITLLLLFILTFLFLPWGYFTLQPNSAKVLVLFGSYKGTIRRNGFHWVNPFKLAHPHSRYTISLRMRNFEGEKLKVNDKKGNPIEIASVVVWRVHDSAQALFEVDHYAQYVKIQSDTAVRHLANLYPYDHGEGEEITLRSSLDEVSLELKKELQDRLNKAGVLVEDARLTHLAYAPEIAGAMLRRQQAEAIIAARKKIVEGAVSMVEMALANLEERHVVELDEERKAAMVSNLLVVLCGESEAKPIINTGTLYK